MIMPPQSDMSHGVSYDVWLINLKKNILYMCILSCVLEFLEKCTGNSYIMHYHAYMFILYLLFEEFYYSSKNNIVNFLFLFSDEFDSYIVVSFMNASLVLSIGETVEEVTESGFLGTTPTLACSQLGEDALIQVSMGKEGPT